MAENCSRLEKLGKKKQANEGTSVVELIEVDFKQTLLMLKKYIQLKEEFFIQSFLNNFNYPCLEVVLIFTRRAYIFDFY